MSRKSKLYRNEVNLARDFLDEHEVPLDRLQLEEIELQICHLKTFSNPAHQRYARMLYARIKAQLVKTRNDSRRFALHQLAQIIELKISPSG